MSVIDVYKLNITTLPSEQIILTLKHCTKQQDRL